MQQLGRRWGIVAGMWLAAGLLSCAPGAQTPRRTKAESAFTPIADGIVTLASPEVGKLTVAVVGQAKKSWRDALASDLAEAGLQVVDASKPHDLEADLRVVTAPRWDRSNNGIDFEETRFELLLQLRRNGRVVAEEKADGRSYSTTWNKDGTEYEPEANDEKRSKFVQEQRTGIRKAASALVSSLVVQAQLAARDVARNSREAATHPTTASTSQVTAPPAASTFLTGAPQPTAYALIVGIEKYRDIPSPTGARADAQHFADVARHTLGIPAAHVLLALDERASLGDIEKHLRWLKANVPAGGRVYFYFSGHGAPEPSSGTSYLLPYDGDPKSLESTAVTLSYVLKTLGETQARDVLAIVDSCFSGSGGRSVLAPGVRPLVRVKVADVATRQALLTAASGAEISGPAANGSEGLFSQYLVQGLGTGQADTDGDGQISLQELLDFVKPRVARDAKRDSRDQTPSLVVGNTVGAPSTFVVAWGLPPR